MDRDLPDQVFVITPVSLSLTFVLTPPPASQCMLWWAGGRDAGLAGWRREDGPFWSQLLRVVVQCLWCSSALGTFCRWLPPP